MLKRGNLFGTHFSAPEQIHMFFCFYVGEQFWKGYFSVSQSKRRNSIYLTVIKNSICFTKNVLAAIITEFVFFRRGVGEAAASLTSPSITGLSACCFLSLIFGYTFILCNCNLSCLNHIQSGGGGADEQTSSCVVLFFFYVRKDGHKDKVKCVAITELKQLAKLFEFQSKHEVISN